MARAGRALPSFTVVFFLSMLSIVDLMSDEKYAVKKARDTQSICSRNTYTLVLGIGKRGEFSTLVQQATVG